MAENENDDNIIPTERFTPDPEIESGKQQQSGNGGSDIPLLINGQYIKDLSFEAPNTPDVFSLIQEEVPAIEVNIDVEASPKDERLFEVSLTVRAEAKIKEQLVYLCEVEYAGLFTVNVAQEHISPVLLIECPLIIFPFMRRIIADLTGDGGFAPLMLSPIDFAALYQQRMTAAQEKAMSEKSEKGNEMDA